MPEITIYKVRQHLSHTLRSGRKDQDDYEEHIIVNNLETAKSIYEKCLYEIKNFKMYKGYRGFCELFIPHTFEDGTLAYWPDNEQYIERFSFGD